MGTKLRPVASLTVADLARVAVWEFAPEDETHDETWVRPVRGRRVTHLEGRVVGTQVRLANGTRVWSLIGDVDLRRPEKTPHFLGATFFRGARRFHLARYHDSEWQRHGPRALARFLGLRVGDVFPIHFDLRAACRGSANALQGVIEQSPKVRLTDSERMRLILEWT